MLLRAVLAAVLLTSSSALVLAQVPDPVLDIAIEQLPDVEVHVPSDRTEFSLPLALPDLNVAELPEVVVAIPAQPKIAEINGAMIIPGLEALPQPGRADKAIASLPPRPVPPPAIVIAPPKVAPAISVEPAKPVASAPIILPKPVAPPAVTPASPASSPAALPGWRERLDKSFAQIGTLGPLPLAVLQSIRSYYDGREARPLFTDAGGLNGRARKALAMVEAARDHGLDPRRFAALVQMAKSGDVDLVEVAVAAVSVAYARDARGARLNPQAVSRLITATPTLPNATEVLAQLEGSNDAAATLEAWNPQHAGYKALRQKLAMLRSEPEHTASIAPKLTFGPVLWIGMSDARVPALRERLALPPVADLTFDAALSEAVKSVQRQNGLRVNGRLDRQTVAALGGTEPETRENAGITADIIANMERWRWLPADLGESHILVNVPAYSLEMKRGGRTVFATRVVVGKPNSPTPIFSHKMEYLVVNPYWNVPPSIAIKEYMPLLQKNPYALQARGLEIISRGRVVDPATVVDWAKVGRSVAIRQPPGERNALGNIKFMFPNDHAVYLHDTPSRGLFSAERRAFSHGCVRVQNPFALASSIMGWSEGRLRGMVGGPERRIDLSTDVDVHLAYFTLEAREDGTLVRREDIYGHQRRTRALLGL